MKLMMVIVQDQDYAKLATRLIQNRIRATKFEKSGLYSNKKNVTLFICVEEEQQERILTYIQESCTERKEICEVWEYNGILFWYVYAPGLFCCDQCKCGYSAD